MINTIYNRGYNHKVWAKEISSFVPELNGGWSIHGKFLSSEMRSDNNGNLSIAVSEVMGGHIVPSSAIVLVKITDLGTSASRYLLLKNTPSAVSSYVSPSSTIGVGGAQVISVLEEMTPSILDTKSSKDYQKMISDIQSSAFWSSLPKDTQVSMNPKLSNPVYGMGAYCASQSLVTTRMYSDIEASSDIDDIRLVASINKNNRNPNPTTAISTLPSPATGITPKPISGLQPPTTKISFWTDEFLNPVDANIPLPNLPDGLTYSFCVHGLIFVSEEEKTRRRLSSSNKPMMLLHVLMTYMDKPEMHTPEMVALLRNQANKLRGVAKSLDTMADIGNINITEDKKNGKKK